MSKNLYTARNFTSVAFHYVATAAIVAGTLLLSPVWAAVAAAVLVGGVSYASIKQQKEFFEGSMIRHPEDHEFSPQLGKIVQDLYQKSGLSAEEYPVYDFRADREKAGKQGAVGRALRDQFNLAAQTHNAAAVNLGRPVIMISEPLLKLLDEKEEKAVLAHEFAHIAARHHNVALPQKLAVAATAFSNTLTTFVAAISAGWVGFLSAVGASVAIGGLFRKLHRNGSLLGKNSDALSLHEVAEKKKVERTQKAVGAVVTASILTYFNPAFLGIFAAAKTMAAAGRILVGTFSRSMEYQADRGAVELGADPLALISSLRKMTVIQERARNDAFEGNPPPPPGFLVRAWKKMTSTHPTLQRRISRLAGMARTQGVGEDAIKQAVEAPVHVGVEHNIPMHVIDAMARM